VAAPLAIGYSFPSNALRIGSWKLKSAIPENAECMTVALTVVWALTFLVEPFLLFKMYGIAKASDLDCG
jgi:hypothetical protein